MTETIERAALRTRGGLVFSVERPGRRHDVIAMMNAMGPFNPRATREEVGASTQGFITSLDRFVDRREARVIADAAGQCIERDGSRPELYSEDVW